MYKHAAEAFVPVPDADKVREKVCARSRDYCQHIGAMDADTLLDFDGGRATLRPTDEGLQFRVEATDLVTFYAIRTLLQGSLSATAKAFGESVEWRPTDAPSFGAFRGKLRTGEDRPRKSSNLAASRKLPVQQRDEALARLAAGETRSDVACSFNVSGSTISRLPSPKRPEGR